MSRTVARCLLFLSLALATGVTPVLASVHLMAIQEVFPGTPADPEAQYVMLRMTSAGQIFTANTYIRLEDEDGNLLGRFGTFTSSVAFGGASAPGRSARRSSSAPRRPMISLRFPSIRSSTTRQTVVRPACRCRSGAGVSAS